MSEASTLPAGFAALEPFVQRWSLATTAERAARRSASTPDEREAFFAATGPLMETALDYLDQRALGDFTPAEQHLMNLMLSFAHIIQAVEIMGPDEAKTAPWRDRMRITRASADRGVAACSN